MFLLPPENGDRMAMGTNTWASEIVFLLLITEVIPGSSGKMPVIGLGNILILLLITVSLALTVISNNYRYIKDCPNWLFILLRRFIQDEENNMNKRDEQIQNTMSKTDMSEDNPMKEDLWSEPTEQNIDIHDKDITHKAANHQDKRKAAKQNNVTEGVHEEPDNNGDDGQNISQIANEKTVVEIKITEQGADNTDKDPETDQSDKKDVQFNPDYFIGHLVDRLCLIVQMVLLGSYGGFSYSVLLL